MEWNYRIGFKDEDKVRLYYLVECHYDEAGRITNYEETEEVLLGWADIQDMYNCWLNMREAFELPPIDLEALDQVLEDSADEDEDEAIVAMREYARAMNGD